MLWIAFRRVMTMMAETSATVERKKNAI